MTDELIIISGLDQPLPVDNNWYLEEIEKTAHEALDLKDPHIIMEKLKEIVMVMKIGGLALARGLYIVSQYWDEFDTSDDFIDMTFDYTGLHRHTIDRYIKVWQMLEDTPEKYKERLMQRNIKDLIPVAHAIDQGHIIGNGVWDKIVSSPDYNTVAKIVREDVKGKEPRKGQLTLMLARDGTINAYMNDEMISVGWVDVDNSSEIAQKAVNRIIDNAGVMRQ